MAQKYKSSGSPALLAAFTLDALEPRRLLSALVHVVEHIPTPANGPAISVGHLTFFTLNYSPWVAVYNAKRNRWTRARLSQTRNVVSVASVGDNAVFFGYWPKAAGGSPVVDIYDTAKRQWSTASLSVARSAAATSVGNRLIFAGGETDVILVNEGNFAGRASAAVDIYNARTDRWSTAHLSQRRMDLCAATAGHYAFFAGGNTGKHLSNVVDIYDNATGQWSTAKLSQAREDITTAVVGDKVLFASGWGTGQALSKVVDIFNTTTKTWTTARLAQPTGNLAVAVVGDKAIFVVPVDEGEDSIADIYDATTNTWSTAPLSTARSEVATAVVGDYALFAGGETGYNYRRDTVIQSKAVDIYDATTGQWSTASLSEPAEGLSAATVGQTAIFAGGWDGSYNDLFNADLFDFR